MSRIDELIESLCPNGVPLRRLGEFAELVRGNGLPKSDFVPEGVGAIHYGQIYTKFGTWTKKTISHVNAEIAEKLTKVNPGDIIITNTSENLEDVGKAVAWLGESQIVTGGHATVIKHQQDSKFLSYWFQSPAFRLQKRGLATGTKVIDVSAKQLEKVLVPVPPLAVQQEIVRILDQFTQLEAELEAELEARRRQFRFHLQSAMKLDPAQTHFAPLGELVDVRSGWGFPNKFQGDKQGTIPFYKVSDMNLVGNEVEMSKSNNYVSPEAAQMLGVKLAPPGTIIFPKIGAAVATNKKRLLTQYAAYDNNVMGLVPSHRVHAPFLYYWLLTYDLVGLANDSGAVPSIRKTDVERLVVPVPSIEVQREVSANLGRFRSIVSDLNSGLPGEIQARRKQYEYYRDKLLTFKELAA